jgi:hypothetical protein
VGGDRPRQNLTCTTDAGSANCCSGRLTARGVALENNAAGGGVLDTTLELATLSPALHTVFERADGEIWYDPLFKLRNHLID